MHLAIIIPVFNEAKVIEDVISELPKSIDAISKISTIIIDDGSTDETREILRLIHRKNTYTLYHVLNRGQGAAVQTGFDVAKRLRADIAVTFDGDGQHKADDIEALIQPILEKKADIVNGSRFKKKQRIPLIRRFYNFGANFVTWLMSGFLLSDSQSGMKALNKKALKEIEIKANGYEFCTELIREASWYKFRIVEVPVHVSYSKYTLKKGQSFANGLTTICKLVIRSLLK
jgi:glycosyltransferase involved in cell wall biosynthesis